MQSKAIPRGGEEQPTTHTGKVSTTEFVNSLAGWLVQREFDERVSEEHGQQQPAASDSKGLQSKILHAPSVDVHPRPAEPCPWRLCAAV